MKRCRVMWAPDSAATASPNIPLGEAKCDDRRATGACTACHPGNHERGGEGSRIPAASPGPGGCNLQKIRARPQFCRASPGWRRWHGCELETSFVSQSHLLRCFCSILSWRQSTDRHRIERADAIYLQGLCLPATQTRKSYMQCRLAGDGGRLPPIAGA